MSKRFIVAVFLLDLLVCGLARADSYRIWADEVDSASRGLKICGDAYFEVIKGTTKPADIPRLKSEARKTCAVLKNNLDITMLTVRMRVNDTSGTLAKYHQSMLKAFDAFVPTPGEAPLDYMVQTQEALLLDEKYRSLLRQLLRE